MVGYHSTLVAADWTGLDWTPPCQTPCRQTTESWGSPGGPPLGRTRVWRCCFHAARECLFSYLGILTPLLLKHGPVRYSRVFYATSHCAPYIVSNFRWGTLTEKIDSRGRLSAGVSVFRISDHHQLDTWSILSKTTYHLFVLPGNKQILFKTDHVLFICIAGQQTNTHPSTNSFYTNIARS